MKPVRLEEYLTSQTTLSRRKVLALINQSQITVNGAIATSLAMPVKAGKDRIRVNSQEVLHQTPYLYYKFHKPKGVLSTLDDPEGRKCLKGFLESLGKPVSPVGRLDRKTQGLIIFTNDGELANRITHPQWKVSKTYVVILDKPITQAHEQRLKSGLFLDDGPAHVTQLETLETTTYRVSVTEGRNRLIRRLFEHLGYEVCHLKRLQIGPLVLGTLQVGKFKALSAHEVRLLKRLVELS